MSNWFFLPPELFEKNTFFVPQELHRHFRALRLKKGDDMVLSDGKSRTFAARLESISSKKAEVSILEELELETEPPQEIILFPAVLKGEKMEIIIRQGVELGACRIVPVLTERTIVRMEQYKIANRKERWQQIALSAASQCRRTRIPQIDSPLQFEDTLELLQGMELTIVPWENEMNTSLLTLLQKYVVPSSLAIFSGPEGGITPAEIEKLKEIKNLYPVSLGPRVLRAETAPLAVLSAVMCFWGHKGVDCSVLAGGD